MAPVRVSFASSAAATPKSTSFADRRRAVVPREQEDVRRLHVAVHDPRRVRGRERVGDRGRDLERLGERERRAPLPLRDVFPLEPLHRDVRLPVVELPERDDPHDPRVREPREDAPLARNRASSPASTPGIAMTLSATGWPVTWSCAR